MKSIGRYKMSNREVLIEVDTLKETDEQRKARELEELKAEFAMLLEQDELESFGDEDAE